MSLIHVHKKSGIAETQHFLQGGILGGNVTQGVRGLVGLTLTFTSPAGAVTFVAGTDNTRDKSLLMFPDIKSQIETAIVGLKVVQIGGYIGFIESSPSSGVALSGNTEQAKALLGFSKGVASAGKVYAGPAGAAPSLIHVQVATDNSHVLYTLE